MFLNLIKLEKKYEDKLSNIKEWNYLRNIYREIRYDIKVKQKQINKAQELSSIFFGFKSWFKSYDYIFFSDSSERKLIEGRYFDTKSDYIIDELGKSKSLVVETPIGKHYKNNYSKNIVSKRLFDFLTLLLKKLYLKKYNYVELNDLNKEINSNIDYSDIIKKFNIQYRLYKIWFKIIKPKYIFLNCFYSKQYTVKAAKDLDIKVVDIQHGIIGKKHSAYNSDIKLDSDYLPDIFLVFGLEDEQSLKNNILFKDQSIYAIGNFYLEYIHSNFKQDKKLIDTISSYNQSIIVSLARVMNLKLIHLLIKVANTLPNSIFILVPRNNNFKEELTVDLPSNIIIFDDLDCYNILMHCDYHATINSTCAMEAPSLGIPNILINIDNQSEEYLSDIFDDKVSSIINSSEEMISVLTKEFLLKKDEIRKLNSNNFITDYKNNIKNITDKIKENKL